RPSTNTTGGRLVISIRASNESVVPWSRSTACDWVISILLRCCRRRRRPKNTKAPVAAGGGLRGLQIGSAHPHIPRPRRKTARTCADAAGEVRDAHGGMNAGREAECQVARWPNILMGFWDMLVRRDESRTAPYRSNPVQSDRR